MICTYTKSGMGDTGVFTLTLQEAVYTCLLSTGLGAALYWAFALRGYISKTGNSKSKGQPHASLRTLKSFEPEEILKDQDNGRVVTLLGRFKWQKKDEMALVKLTARPLSLNGLKENLHQLKVALKVYSGAEFAYYDCSMPLWKSFWNAVQSHSYSLEVVAPASEYTIRRNRPVVKKMVIETGEMYASVTAPYIDKLVGGGGALKWLVNILSKEKEAERILYTDNDPVHGFIMNVDTKWGTHPNVLAVPREEWFGHASVTDLYCLAICQRKDIRTLRDLRAVHIPMLKEIYSRGVQTIEEVYGVPEDQLRIFVHYMPQFFHFHVHFCRLHNTIGVEVERAHLLLNTIENLERDDGFYSKCTIQFAVYENDALLNAFKAAEE